MSIRKNIFVDIDETLIHAEMDPEYESEVPIVDVMTHEPDETYKVSVRPGAIELLYRLRAVGHVYALTRATHDYALAMNKTLGFGFTVDRIYSREQVREWRKTKIDLDIPQGQNYLIDDLDFQDNYEKIALLRKLGTLRYIKVDPFYGFTKDELTDSKIDEIINIISA